MFGCAGPPLRVTFGLHSSAGGTRTRDFSEHLQNIMFDVADLGLDLFQRARWLVLPIRALAGCGDGRFAEAGALAQPPPARGLNRQQRHGQRRWCQLKPSYRRPRSSKPGVAARFKFFELRKLVQQLIVDLAWIFT